MSDPTTWRELQTEAATRLARAGIDRPEAEARWMVERASGFDPPELLARGAEPATKRVRRALEALVARRVEGEPVQYVLGAWPFRELDLLVDRRVLIPRPETEVVAEVAIEEAARLGARRGRPDPWAAATTEYKVADLGTGSGALALALAGSLPDAEVWATDVSADALAVARANLAGAGLPATRVRLAQGSWYAALPADLRGRLRLVVANPPYVAEHEVDELPREVADWEPRRALVSGPTGLEGVEAIVGEAPTWLEAGGVLVCEIAPHQAAAAAELGHAAGFAEVQVRRDLADRDRIIVARAAR